ncbi:uncharacterized protein BO80DRAFT_442279 [Aspergillus ibericus CBS 121593]|uniref:Uncharacterized protein n=1 Tax=Aspergillus ibericus CBS 121593 TaxID=1448316 RepID=A0A395H706_9EURO|nr:hypothetical protein BO80DRAFT_442279 [Aspergillus ibericus CBS 121593]RAL03697.1 hypothetical protein BO80DRAFT_442279 [Aspergillus ibericus CBS 121593]
MVDMCIILDPFNRRDIPSRKDRMVDINAVLAFRTAGFAWWPAPCATTRRLYQLIGKTNITDIPPEWVSPAYDVLEMEENAPMKSNQDPNFKNAEIRGSEPHYSHDDPTDDQEVISVRIKDEKMKTLRRLHIHKDGSVKRVDGQG